MAKIDQINVGVVGVGWVGGIRATAVKKNPIVHKLYIHITFFRTTTPLPRVILLF